MFFVSVGAAFCVKYKILNLLLTNAKFFVIIVCVTRKYPLTFAAMAQLVEHILGKDEVPGPNPGSSSKHPQCSVEHWGFGFFMGMLGDATLALYRATHT